MTDFKLDPKKYEGHTEGPLEVIEFAGDFWIIKKGMGWEEDPIATIAIEGKAYPNSKLFADAPLLLAHCVKLEEQIETDRKLNELVNTLERQKAELVDALTNLRQAENKYLVFMEYGKSKDNYEVILLDLLAKLSLCTQAADKALKKAKGGE